jgi:hypothetical protein
MSFWERTWQERADAIRLAYGDTSPADTVISFSWKDDPLRCPGACALCFPPIPESRDPVRRRRDDWLYLTMGLSQPLDKKQVEQERAAGKSYSAFGLEFAFVVPNRTEWPPEALRYFMTYMTEGELIKWGDRFPFAFHQRSEGRLGVYTGNPAGYASALLGAIRAVVFWPFLFPDWQFITSTGKFMVMVATGITAREWQLVKSKTTAHVLLLLCRAGIWQRTLPERACLLSNPSWQQEWTAIEGMSPAQCQAELQAGVGRWHLAGAPMPGKAPAS